MDARSNTARFPFFEPAAHDPYIRREDAVADCVASLRVETGRAPRDPHEVRPHQTIRRSLCHPAVEEVELHFEARDAAQDPGLHIFICSADPGTASAAALERLVDRGALRAVAGATPPAVDPVEDLIDGWTAA